MLNFHQKVKYFMSLKFDFKSLKKDAIFATYLTHNT